MRAVGVTEFGGPEQLKVIELEEPETGPGEVKIQVHAASVNPTDTALRSGARAEQLKDVRGPYVPGMDAAGMVEEIGDDARCDLSIGEHVMAIVLPLGVHGAYAEYVVVPYESVVRAPKGTSDVEASTIPMNGLTARQALDRLAVPPGGTIAVTGAAGAVGGYAIELAKSEGLAVVADASSADEALVKRLGADVVVERGEGLAARIREIVPEGVDGVVDGALYNEKIAPAVRDGGRIATVRGYVGESERAVTYHPVWVRDYAREHDRLDQLRVLVEEAKLTPRVARTFPAEHAAEAHRLLEGGGTRGRLVLTF